MRVARFIYLPALIAIALAVPATALSESDSGGPTPIQAAKQPLTSTSETLSFGHAAPPSAIHEEGANEELESGLEGAGAPPKEKPYKPHEPPTADAPGTPSQHALLAASDPFTIFNTSPSNPAGGSAVQEPTVADGDNVLLATGNTWAQVSTDDGLTWPSDLVLNTAKNPPTGDRVCCDQIAYSTEHDGTTMFFWLIQDDCAGIACGKGNPTKQNALTLRVFRGTKKLLAGQAERIILLPTKFGFNGDFFDYNKMSSTKKYLYISTDVRTFAHTSAGSVVIRIALDDLNDGDHKVHFGWWPVASAGSMAPVEHAGSTMYLAAHDTDTKQGDILRIFSVDDSSKKLKRVERNVNNFGTGTGSCPSPDGDDPCQRFGRNQTVGFHSGSSVGWLWIAPQDSSFAFPQVRVAVFHINSLKHITQRTIYNRDYAFTYPAVGVNDRGDVGVIVYRMGGGEYPSPDAFIRTDPTDWSHISLHRIVTGVTSFKTNTWGDYASVHAFAGCSNTFLGSAWSVQGTSTKPVAENRSVWFGDPADGCPDLTVSAAIAAPGTVSIGDVLSIVATTKNLGGATAGESSTRYYLSKDAVKSSSDVLMSTSTPVPALVPHGVFTTPTAVSAIIPVVAPGAYRLLACADDLNTVNEVTGGNNCLSPNETITVS